MGNFQQQHDWQTQLAPKSLHYANYICFKFLRPSLTGLKTVGHPTTTFTTRYCNQVVINSFGFCLKHKATRRSTYLILIFNPKVQCSFSFFHKWITCHLGNTCTTGGTYGNTCLYACLIFLDVAYGRFVYTIMMPNWGYTLLSLSKFYFQCQCHNFLLPLFYLWLTSTRDFSLRWHCYN